MGGRGSKFKDIDPVSNEEKYWTDYGDADDDVESKENEQNNLTKRLKDNNIMVCKSFKNLDDKVAEVTLKQISDLTQEYSNIVNSNLEDEAIKIRSFKMNRVSIKTGAKNPEYGIMALFTPFKKQICFNERSVKDLESLNNIIKASQESGHSVTTDDSKKGVYVITHEYGHFLENCIIEKHIQQDVRAWAKYKTGNLAEVQAMRVSEAQKIRDTINEITIKKFKASEKQLETSDYGETSAFEWFAEVFAESKLHTTNKPLVKAMKEYLKGGN